MEYILFIFEYLIGRRNLFWTFSYTKSEISSISRCWRLSRFYL